MCNFTYPVFIPSLNKSLYFNEFTNKQYKNFVKIILNDDIEAFNSFVDNLLVSLCPSLNLDDINVLDKIYILYSIRAGNVGSILEFNVELDESDEKVKFQIDLNDLLNKLESIDINFTEEIIEGGFHAKISIPRGFTKGDSLYDSLYDCISEIKFKDKSIVMSQYTREQQIEILNNLPGTTIPKLIKLIEGREKILRAEPFIDINIDCELPFDKQMHVSLLNNSLYELVKLAFNTDLKEFYVCEYTLIKKFKFSYEHINSITPAELNLYFNVISEDLEREKKERDSQDQGNQFDPNMSSSIS